MPSAVRLETTVTPDVNRRLRMLHVLQGGAFSRVLTAFLDQALPSTAELASQLAAEPQSAQAS